MVASLLRSDSLKLGDSSLVSMVANVLRADGLKLSDEAIISLVTAIIIGYSKFNRDFNTKFHRGVD
jgi:hypothetical protein